MPRRSVGAMLVVTLLCCITCARANPVPGPDITARLRVLATKVAASDLEAAEEAFSDTLGAFGFGWLDESTLALVGEHLQAFAPLLAASQTPPHHLDRQLNGWLRDRADAETKRLICEVLRARLTEPEALLRSRQRVLEDETPDRQERRRWLTEETRMTAAEILSAWRDTLAIPLIQARQESMLAKAGSWDHMPQLAVTYWWYLRQAALRIRDPLASAIAYVGDDGRVRVVRDTSEIRVARQTDLTIYRHPDLMVSRPVAAHLLELLIDSSEVIRRPEIRNWGSGWRENALFVQLSDGAEWQLRVMEDGTMSYSDNLRSSRAGFQFRNPEMLSLFLEIASAFEEERGGVFVSDSAPANERGTPN